MKKKTISKPKQKSHAKAPAIETFVEARPLNAPTRLSLGFLSDEQASILNDYIRLFVGSATPFPTDSSGVYMNRDRIMLTQWYMEMAGYDLYDEVERDPQVAAVMMSRKLAVAGLQWRIVAPDTDDERAVEVARQVERKIRRIPAFFQDTVELLDCIGKGFAWSEIIWGVDDEGWIVPNEILNRPQRRMQFDAATRWPKIRTIDDPFYGKPVEERKHIIHRNSQKYENPFGDPIDQSLYWMWLFKRNVIKFWMQHAESTSAPVPLVEHPAEASAELKQEATEIAKKIRIGSYGSHPDNFKVNFAQATGAKSTSDTYEAFMRFADEQITKRVLGQTLTTEASGAGGSGSRALGSVHQTVRQDIQEFDARSLAETLTHTLVQWICEFNYSGLKDYPHFEFVLDDSVNVLELSSAVASLTAAGKIVSDDYIEKVIGIQLDREAMAAKKLVQSSEVIEAKQIT